MEHSFNKLLRILSGHHRPIYSSFRRHGVENFLAKQADFICDDWTIAAREERRLWVRRAR